MQDASAPIALNHMPPAPRRPGRVRRVLRTLRGWLIPIIFVGFIGAIVLLVGVWVLRAAFDRDTEENIAMVQRRVEWQLAGFGPWQPPEQTVFSTLATEVLADPRVQAVCAFDFTRQKLTPSGEKTGEYVAYRVLRSGVVGPEDVNQIDDMLNADPNSLRRKLPWHYNLPILAAELSRRERRQVTEAEARQRLIAAGARQDMLRGYIYLDLSRPQLQAHFKAVGKDLLKRMYIFGVAAVVVASALTTFAWRAMQKLGRVRFRAALEQQGMQAERGLTAAVLAHEIRNPLAALRFQLHSLRKNSTDTLRVDKTCDTIDGELSRIQQLVQDYLAHEKAQTMRVAAVNLAEAVRALQTLMDEFLRDSRTELVVREPGRPVVVSCDPAMLRQVLMNLVLNAQQAMGRGGRITLALSDDAEFGQIDVIDTGPGIPGEMRQRLFKPFQTSKKEGSGIGLALVKRFVDNFGGTVTVDSEIGRGTAFHLRLPLSNPQHVSTTPSAPGPEHADSSPAVTIN